MRFMHNVRFVWIFPVCLFGFATTFFAACSRQPCDGGEAKGPTARLDISLASCNARPTAEIDLISGVQKRASVILDGTPSKDPNHDPLSFQWELRLAPEGSLAALGDKSSINASFVPDRGGAYVVALTVNDGELDSPLEELSLSVGNAKPIAVAGEDFAAPVGSIATFDGSMSSDADSDTLSYTWTIDQVPPGSTARFDDPHNVHPSFLVDVAGTYTVSLRVNDSEIDSDPDVVRVGGGVTGVRPIAQPGSNLTGVVGRTVYLDGSSSSDPEGASLTYVWRFASQPGENLAVLNGANTPLSSFVPVDAGVYDVELVVNDGFFDSRPGHASVSVGYGTGVAGDLCEVAGCKEHTTCFDGTCVGTGALRFSLSWSVISDFDLHVKTPNGTEIFYGNTMAAGGFLDVDDCVGNACRAPNAHVENIVFEDDPMPGVYEVWVENFSGGAAGSFRVEITGAAHDVLQGSLPAAANAESTKKRVTVN